MASHTPEPVATDPSTSSGLESPIMRPDKPTLHRLHPPHLDHLASTVLHDLQYQHDWTLLSIHTHSSLTGIPLPRPLVSGLPPRRIYVHPDEQVELLKAKHNGKGDITEHREVEWVLPTHLSEKWSIMKFSDIFDAIDTVPPGEGYTDTYNADESIGQQWRGKRRCKRVLLATLHDDSTIVYYIMHDGIVKPRQN